MTEYVSRREEKTIARRYHALWFPFLPTDRLHRECGKPLSGKPDERPLVVVEKIKSALRLVAIDQRARAFGLTPGLALADARARLPEIEVAEANEKADADLLTRLAALCELFTPLVAFDLPNGLMLDITGCTHLFGNEDRLLDELRRKLSRLGFAICGSVAGTPDGARAFVRFGTGGIIATGEQAERARSLPVTALEMPIETTLALTRAGLKTLGDLAERPSVLLSTRFSAELTTRLNRIIGHEDIRITPLRPAPDCCAERRFPEPLMQTEAIEGVVENLAREVATLLERRGAGGRQFEISLFRTDGVVRRLTLETGHPCREVATLLRLFRLRVETLADPVDPGFGFDAIRLSVPRTEPMRVRQRDLDGKGVEEASLDELIDRLVTRLGRERVLRFIARETHHPERAAACISATMPVPSANWPVPESGSPPVRPLLLFEPPQPIETLAEVPDGPPMRFRWRRVLHEIARAEGPERIAPEWWRDGPNEPTRDYYRIEDSQGARFWVFRAGLFEREMERPRWFLHGLFP